MLPADCLQKLDPGTNTPVLIIQTPSGRRFRYLESLGAGGVGCVHLVIGPGEDGRLRRFALKEYPRPEDEAMRLQQQHIRANLAGLIREPVCDDDGQPLQMMVAPIEIIDFPKTGTFGYVMDYVDLESYVTLSELLQSEPQADLLCRVARQLSHFFDRLAGSAGKCYKDINEDNIYIHHTTGEIRIIDNDNVGAAAVRTIAGTPFYMAPEVQDDLQAPDRLTDRFSMAVFLLRLFTGAYPYDGRRTLEQMQQRGMTVYEIAPEAFGRDAIFVFDPDNDANSLHMPRPPADAAPEQQRLYRARQAQCALWHGLPIALREAFVRTFTRGCRRENRSLRTTARQWHDLFARLEQQLIRCSECGRMIFGSSRSCPDCGAAVVMHRCADCGLPTPRDAEICIHCGSRPDAEAQPDTPCPHCGALNRRYAVICRSCGRHIRISCAKCGSIQPGDAMHCSRCHTPLYRACPACGRLNPQRARHCAHCSSPMASTPRRCPACGRMPLRGQLHCIRCGTQLTDAPACVRTADIDIHIKLPTGVEQCRLQHTFPAGADDCLHADSLHPSLPHEPLFTLLYRRDGDRIALQNRTGRVIDCYCSGTADMTPLPPDGRILLAPGDVIRFDAQLQIRIHTMN